MRSVAVALIAGLSLSACGGSPNRPTPPASAPTLVAPPDDAVAANRPSLVVNNVSSGPGARTYDFQLADSEPALAGPAEALLASATGIAEGAGGRTSYDVPRDLQPGRRYFWRARAIQNGASGAWSGAFRFRTEAVPNTPPVIQSMMVAPRAEVNTGMDVSAVVTDQETNPANLTYAWTATGGTFAGTGVSVRWTPPAAAGTVVLTLTVTEKYTVAVPGGGEETRENRVSANATVKVHDSPREITTLATTFIDDFLHSERSPEFCVRNFSDACPGKREELNDIRENRRLFVNDPGASKMGAASIAFYDDGAASRRKPVPAAEAGFADLRAPCTFASTYKPTGAYRIVVGTCQLTSVYESGQWRLCDSHFLSSTTLSGVWSRFRF